MNGSTNGMKCVEYSQNGGGCDQKPVSVHTMLASPTSRWPSVQLNVIRAPTGYLRCAELAWPLWPSMRPLRGTRGCVHWIAANEEMDFCLYSSDIWWCLFGWWWSWLRSGYTQKLVTTCIASWHASSGQTWYILHTEGRSTVRFC